MYIVHPRNPQFQPLDVFSSLRRSASFHHHLSRTPSSQTRWRILLPPAYVYQLVAHVQESSSALSSIQSPSPPSVSRAHASLLSICLSPEILPHEFPSHSPSRKSVRVNASFLHPRLSIQSPEDNRNPKRVLAAISTTSLRFWIMAARKHLPHYLPPFIDVTFTEPILKETRPPFSPLSRPGHSLLKKSFRITQEI